MPLTLEQKQAAAEQALGTGGTAPVTASGLGKAAATGVRGGVEGIAGLGDVAKGQRWLVKKIAGMLGAPEQLQETLGTWSDRTSPFSLMPTSADVGEVTDKGVAQLPEGVSAPIQDITRHQAQNPWEQGAETAGAFAGGAALPVGEVGALANIGTRAARVLAPTAAVEGSGALADAADLDPETKQAVQVVAALVAGGGTGAIENSFRARSAARVVASNPKAVRVISERMRADGVSPDEFLATMDRLGPQAVPADVGTNLRQETQRIQAAGGEGRGIIEPRLTERNVGKGERLGVDVTQAVGPEVQRTDVLSALKDRAQTLGAEQQDTHALQQQPVDAQSVIDDINTRLGNEKSPSKRAMLQKIKDAFYIQDQQGTATGVLDPSSEGLLSARHFVRDLLYEPGGKKVKTTLGPDEAQMLKDYYAKINQTMDPANPALREVDAKIEQTKKEGAAFKEGEKIYENPREAASAVEFQRNWDKLSAGERSRVLEGVNRETWRQLGIGANDLVELKKLLKGEGKWNTQKLATVIGQDKTDALWQAIDREATFANTYKKVVEGSKTAESQPQPGADRFVGDVGDAAVTGALAGPKAGLIQLGVKSLKRLAQKMATGNPDANNPAIAKLLMSDNPAELMRAITMMRNIQPAIVPEAATAALQERLKKREPTDIGTITKGNR